MPFYPWGVIEKAEDILKSHDQFYPLYLQVNFPQLHVDYPEQIPEDYRERTKRIPFEARRVYAGMFDMIYLSNIDFS